ncbi:hypothetical protein [Pseudoduganella violaceinigra]|uniref:hypothetical protein n=1 Tax=Pseudoduganella violaceinigra TaxID=246602 RepID=UPI00042745EB|nr:hypothetical protein [Pseudoduganella violaceinigra]
MAASLKDLGNLVEQVFDDEADYDEVRARLDTYLAAHPGEAEAYRLRARLLEGGYEVISACVDWLAAARLDPSDRDSALKGLRIQYRWAHALAEEQLGLNEEDGEEVDEDEEEEEDYEPDPRLEALTLQIKNETIASLRTLAAAHAADAPFTLQLLSTMENMALESAWLPYEFILSALAANPTHAGLLKAEAKFIAHSASGWLESEQIPAGFFEDANGTRYHAATVMQALDAIAAVPGLADEGELLDLQAGLLRSLSRYEAAAAAYAQAAVAWDRAAAAATDEEERESLTDSAEESRREAEQCAGGRRAVQEGQLAAMREAAAKLKEMRGRFPEMGNAGDDAELEALCGQWEQQQEDQDAGPDAEQLAELSGMAEKIADQVVGLLSFDPVELVPQDAAKLPGGVNPWFAEIAPALLECGLQLQTGFDNPWNTRMLKAQCQGQLWSDAAGSVALTAETVKTLQLVRIFSELEDGTLLLTAANRGKSMFSSGPRVDVLSLDPDIPLADMLRLHQARLARTLAAHQGSRAQPLNTLERMATVETHLRKFGVAFRLEQGITEVEVLGMHVFHHKAFFALIRDAVDKRLAPLR